MVSSQEVTSTLSYASVSSLQTFRGKLQEVLPVHLVEHVLCPLSVAFIGASNVTLLAHEACVVWRTRRVTPPKLLVLALASADTLATLIGFLPLWILSDTQFSDYNVSAVLDTSAEPASSELQQQVTATNTSSGLVFSEGVTVSMGEGSGFNVLTGAGYSLCLFLLVTFWTMAQCIVVVMGVERVLALRAPFFYTAHCSCTAFLLVLAALTLASGAMAGMHLFVHLREAVLPQHSLLFAGFMEADSLALNCVLIAQGVLWTMVLLLCNWAVMYELRRMERRVTVMRAKDHSEYLKQLSLVHGSGREFSRLMMAINALFVSSSFPHLVCLGIRLCHWRPTFSVQYFCWRMSHLPSLINPFLYGFLRKSLRSRIRRGLENYFLCLRSNRVSDAGAHARTVHYNVAELPSAIRPQDPEASTIHISG